MADMVYFSSIVDGNGEVHFERHEDHVVLNAAALKVQAIKRSLRPNDYICNDPTLAAYHEPQPPVDDGEQGDG